MSLTRSLRSLVAAAALALGLGLAGDGSTAQAQNPYTIAPQYDLFYNYYAGPPGTPAAMYVSPRPVPTFVGHTYITYQPLLPHEYMWRHHRTYCRHAGGLLPVNVTSVRHW